MDEMQAVAQDSNGVDVMCIKTVDRFGNCSIILIPVAYVYMVLSAASFGGYIVDA